MRRMLKKLKSDNQGAAMAVALLCIMVLSLLGTALWQYFMADTNHTAKDEKGMQAYYLARSGADAVARYIIKNPDNKTPEQLNAFINTLSTSPKSNAVAFGKGTFAVQVTKDLNAVLHIKSEGIVGDTKKNINLTLIPSGIPETPSNALDANKDLGWFSGNSFNIDKNEYGNKSVPVKFNPGNGAEHINLRPNGAPYFRAPGIYFEHKVTVDNKSILKLTADTIVVRGSMILNDQQAGLGQISLTGPYNNNSVDESTIPEAKYGVQYGKIYLENGVYVGEQQMVPSGEYYFPAGCKFPPTGFDKYDEWTADDAGLILIGSASGYKEVWN